MKEQVLFLQQTKEALEAKADSIMRQVSVCVSVMLYWCV